MTDSQPDVITVLRMHLATDPPGLARFYMCPRLVAARYVADAADGNEATDLGPGALLYTQAAKPEEFHRDGHRFLVLVGVAQGDRWLLWTPPAPVEPVPGGRGHTASRN